MRALRPRRADSRARRPTRCRRWRRELAGRPHRADLRAAGRRASTATRPRSSTPTARCSACTGRCTSRTTRCSTRSTTSRPATALDATASARRGQRLQGVEDALRDHRRADLLGPVVSRRRRASRACSARRSSSTRPRSAGIRPRRTSGAQRRSTPGARSSARTRSPTASTSPSPNRIGHEDEPGTNGITFFGHSFIADPFGRYRRRSGRERRDPDRPVRPGAHRRPSAATGRSCATAASTPTAPILSRYLGA